MPFRIILSVVIVSLAAAAGLVYGSAQLGAIFFEAEVESMAGFRAIQLDISQLGGEAKAILWNAKAEAERTKADVKILGRDLQGHYTRIKPTNLYAVDSGK